MSTMDFSHADIPTIVAWVGGAFVAIAAAFGVLAFLGVL